MVNKEEEKVIFERHYQQLLIDLTDFDDPEKQLEALKKFKSWGTTLFQREDAVEPIIAILQHSKKFDLRVTAVRALGNIRKKPELVMPVLLQVLKSDRSLQVKERIPFALAVFGLDALNHLFDILNTHKDIVRINTIKVLGRMNPQSEIILPVLKKALAESEDINEQCKLYLSIIRLEGFNSNYIKKFDEFIKKNEALIDDLTILSMEIQVLKQSLEHDRKHLLDQQTNKEKWYKRKDFHTNILSGLTTFDKNEKGRSYQNRYANYIISLMKTRLFTTISLESLGNFPSKNLPPKIIEVLESDFAKSKEFKTNKEARLEIKRDKEYTHYSEIFNYLSIIRRLSVFNLDYILNAIKFKDKSEKLNEFQLEDVYNTDFLQSLGLPAKSPLSILEDDYSEKTEISRKFEDCYTKIQKEVLNFKQHSLYQEVCIQFMNFEAFLFDSIECLIELYPDKKKDSKSILINKNGKMYEIDLEDFTYKKKFSDKIDYLIKNTLIGKSWLNRTERRQSLDCFRTKRNCITHYNGRKVKKYSKSKCLEDTQNNEYLSIDSSYIDEILLLVLEFSRELYNEIANLIKT